MKIVILNSADSVASNTYLTTLNTIGFEKADKMVDLLESIKPDIIYSSPFIRALQTIYPFCKNIDSRVLPECSLYPIKKYDKLLKYFIKYYTYDYYILFNQSILFFSIINNVYYIIYYQFVLL